MKVAVYTIAKNEEQFVERWYNSIKDADYILIADTGSTDKTVEIAKKLGISTMLLNIDPWRFDDSRNAALAALPKDIDYCIALDMDEVILPGWKKELEKAFTSKATRPRYKYTWSWNLDGSPGLQYNGEKIHSRNGYRWKHPVHEVLIIDRIIEKQFWVDLEIHHYPDNYKSRSQYLDLLKLSTLEDPYDDRNAHYYARELFFNNKYSEAIQEFNRHLSLPKAIWKPERAASYRYLAKCDLKNTEFYLLKAIEEDSSRKESLAEISYYYYTLENWKDSLTYAKLAISIKDKPLDYLCEAFAWGSLPFELAAIASFNLEEYEDAIKYNQIAIDLSPEDQRLKSNMSFYLDKIK